MLCRGGKIDGEAGRPHTTTPLVISGLESASLKTTGPAGPRLGMADELMNAESLFYSSAWQSWPDTQEASEVKFTPLYS